MTEDQGSKLDELHDFFMKPAVEGRPSRAQEIDDLLLTVRAGKLGWRIILSVCGLVIALAATWAILRAK